MRKLKLLIWCPFVNPGGGARLLTRLVLAWVRQPDIEFMRLAAPSWFIESIRNALNDNDLSGSRGQSLRIENCRIQFHRSWLDPDRSVLKFKGKRKIIFFFRKWIPKLKFWLLATELRYASRNCDLIYVFWPHFQRFFKLNKPMVCTFHDTTAMDFPEILGGHETETERRYSERWFRESTRVIVSSHVTQKSLIRHFGEQGKTTIVIPYTAVSNNGASGAYRSKWLDQLPRQYIVYPATLTTHKNHYTLLVAWSRFKRRKEIPLVLLGPDTQVLNSPTIPENWQHARLAGLIARSGLKHKEDIYILGYVDDKDVMPIIRHATALIMPSLAEGGGGFPVEEALSVGIPVLCSDIPVVRENLEGRCDSVCWFDPESPDSILQALDEFFSQYEDFKQRAMKAMNYPRPDMSDIAKKYVGVFREVFATNENVD